MDGFLIFVWLCLPNGFDESICDEKCHVSLLFSTYLAKQILPKASQNRLSCCCLFIDILLFTNTQFQKGIVPRTFFSNPKFQKKIVHFQHSLRALHFLYKEHVYHTKCQKQQTAIPST